MTSDAGQKIRRYFSQIIHQVDNALIPGLSESYPEFADDVKREIQECQVCLDEAFYPGNSEDRTTTCLEYFAHRLAALHATVMDPNPGDAFAINKRVVENAFDAIEGILGRRYEVLLPKGEPPGSLAY